MTSSPRDELLARLIHMRDKCGLNPADGIRAAYQDGSISLDTANWLIDRMIDHELDRKIELRRVRAN